MRPCPACGEARQSCLLDLGASIFCATCGHAYSYHAPAAQGAVVIRPGVRVVARGTSGGRPVRPGVWR